MSTITIEPVRRSIGVDCSVEEAWRVFTQDAASWWPLATHSIGGERAREIVFDGRAGGEVREVLDDGSTNHWAEVLVWEPPTLLVLGWDVGDRRSAHTEVEVRFSPSGAGTRVELERRGWERWEDGSDARESYDTGWEFVLGRFAERINGTA